MDHPLAVPARPTATDSLRPASIGELLDRAFYYYRLNFLALVGFVAALLGPAYAIQLLLTAAAMEVPVVACLLLPLLLATNVLLLMTQAGVGYATGLWLLTGRTAGLREMLRSCWSLVNPLAGTAIAGVLLTLLAFLALIIPPVGAALLVLIAVSTTLAQMVVVFERRTGFAAIRRGWDLVTANVWRVVGTLGLLYVMTLLLSLVLGAGLGAAMATLENTLLLQFASTIANVVVQIFLIPLSAGVTALLYFDLRFRREGLDVAVAAMQASAEPVSIDALPATETTGDWLHAPAKYAITRLSLVMTVVMLLGFCVGPSLLGAVGALVGR